jgi:hypothetical protein
MPPDLWGQEVGYTEKRHKIELTPEQKGLLASLAEEVRESASSLLDEMFEVWR